MLDKRCLTSKEIYPYEWFDSLDFNFLKNWLFQLIDSNDFLSIMIKYERWEPTNTPIYTKFL